MKGDREACLGCAKGLNQQSGLKCTEHSPSPSGSGYHRIYGETTKHASEASVLNAAPPMVDWNRGIFTLPEPVELFVLFWWMHEPAFDIGLILLSQYPAQPGVQHAT